MGNCAQQINYIQVAEVEAEQLRQRFDENIQMRIRDNDEILQVLHKPSGQSLQVRSEAGNRRPLGSGASGECYWLTHLKMFKHILLKEPLY
ncbi:hypothetical protein J4731_06945 [Providencia rettgeri]|nr:hypothetical protein [Providencia rettgeri]